MSVDVPQMNDLLSPVPIAQYDDNNGPQRGGARHLSSLLPALSSAIGYPTATAVHQDPRALQKALELPDARSAVVVLVDGLGYWNLTMRLGHAPYMRSLMADSVNQQPISTCTPSTTVTAMSTFGTGTCPGLTCMTGYTQRNPVTGQISQLIQFKQAIEPHDLQRQPTVFELLTKQGVRVTSCGLPKFAASPLTEATLRGSNYISHVNPNDRVRAAATASAEPGLTYLYIRDTDKVGHTYGWDSDKWIGTFERVDAQLALLHRSVPHDTLIVIAADHGMIMADPTQRIDIAEHDELSRNVAAVGGEPRAPMLYVDDNSHTQQVVERWREFLSDRALVYTRTQALERGIFGQIDPRATEMIGDIPVYALGTTTIVDSRSQSDPATRLPSVHGSRTMLEMDIPCLIDQV